MIRLFFAWTFWLGCAIVAHANINFPPNQSLRVQSATGADGSNRHIADAAAKLDYVVMVSKDLLPEPQKIQVVMKITVGEGQNTSGWKFVSADTAVATVEEKGRTTGTVSTVTLEVTPVTLAQGKVLVEIPQHGSSESSRCEAFSLLPVEVILDYNNVAYKPDSEAIGVSNYVTNNELPATSQFNDTNPDPENFRLQARLPNATTNSIVMKLEVKRAGAVVSTTNHTLDKKDGDFVRGQFLRLVTDTDDDAVSSEIKRSW